jgi:hypothetical protein
MDIMRYTWILESQKSMQILSTRSKVSSRRIYESFTSKKRCKSYVRNSTYTRNFILSCMCHEIHFFRESRKYKTFGSKAILLVMSPIDSFVWYLVQFANRILLEATRFFPNLIVKIIPILIYTILKNNIYVK